MYAIYSITFVCLLTLHISSCNLILSISIAFLRPVHVDVYTDQVHFLVLDKGIYCIEFMLFLFEGDLYFPSVV